MVKVIKHKFLISFIVLLFVSVASLFVFSSKAATVSAADDDLFVMDHGASICLTQDGLRFRVRMGKNVYDRITMNDDGDKVRLAFLIAPSYFFDAAESEDYYNSLSKKVVVNISDESKIYQVGSEYWANGCIGDLASESLSVKQMDYVFSAIACIIDNTTATTTYTYADFAGGSRENNTRSQYYVINAAALDPNHDYTERLTSTDGDVNPYADWFGTNAYPIKVDTDAQYGQLIQLVDVANKDFGSRVIAIKDTVDTSETPTSAPSGLVTSHYVSFYNGEDLVASNMVLDGGSVARPATPTKASDTRYTYSFNKWVDDEDADVDLDDVTSSLNVYAAYNSVGQIYNVTFNYADGQSEVKSAQYGVGLLSSPSIFACGHTQEHGFSIVYKSGSAVVTDLDEIESDTTISYGYRKYAIDYDYTEDVVYTNPETSAQMTQNSFIKSATTVSGDFEISSTITATQEYWGKVGYAVEDSNGKVAMFMVNKAGFAYRYGTDIDKYQTFTNAGHGNGTYWDYRVADIFTGTVDGHYIVSATSDFKLAYNAETDTVTCLIGGVAKHEFDLSTEINSGLDFTSSCNVYFVAFNYQDTYSGGPVRDTDEPHFKFSDMVISDELTTYTITWKDGDGNTLSTDTVKLGELPAYTGATPTKAATAQYSYTFNDTWNTTPVKAYADATYTAQFDSAVNSYTITFEDYDGSVLDSQSVEYGSMPEEPVVDVVNFNGLAYVFTEWDSTIVSVTEAATYTASREFVTYGIDYNSTTEQIETAFITEGNLRAGNNYAKLPYTANYDNGFTLSASITASEVFWPMVGFTVADSRGYGLLISVNRNDITFRSVTNKLTTQGELTAKVNSRGLNNYGTTYGYCSINSSTVKFEIKFSAGTFYVFVQDKLEAVKSLSELKSAMNSRTILDTGSYEFYASAYRVENWKTADNTTSYSARTEGLANFAWNDVSFSDSFEPADYTITWKDGSGSTLATDTVALGEVPVYSGSTPTKASTAQFDYTFSGWTTTPVMAYEDATYTAQFDSSVREYTITFNDFDDSLIEAQSVAYGSTPTPPTMDIVAYNGLAYVFQSWDVTPVAVTGDATYTAVRDYDAQGFAYNGTTGKVESTLHTTGLHLNYNDNYAMLPYEADPDDGFVIKTTIRAQQVHFPASGIMIVDYSNPSAAKKPGFAITVGKGRFLFYHLTDYTTHSGYTSKEDGSSVFYAPMGFNDYGTRLADYDKTYANNTQAKDSPYDSTATLEIRFCNDTLYAFANESLIWSVTLSELNSAWGKTVLDPNATSLRFCLFSYRVEDWKTASSTYYARTPGTPHITFSDITFADSCTVLSSPEVAAKYADGVGYTPIVENISLPVADASNPEKTVYSISAVINASTSTLSNGQYCGIMINTHGATTNTVRLIVRNDSGTIKYHLYCNGTDLTYGGMPSTASTRHEISLQITSKGKIAVYVDGSRRKNDVYSSYGSVPMTADLSVLSNVETVGSSSALILYYSTYERP